MKKSNRTTYLGLAVALATWYNQEDTTNSIKRRGYNTYKDNVEKTVINCTRDRKCGNIENARVNRTDIFELYNL